MFPENAPVVETMLFEVKVFAMVMLFTPVILLGRLTYRVCELDVTVATCAAGL